MPVTTSIAAEIESLITPWIAPKEQINLVIGIIHGEDRWTKGWGSSNQPDSNCAEIDPPNENTLFEIGSITKVFTSTLLALLVEQGKLALNTPINQLEPIYQKLPDAVTLERLATHTSGLPRLPHNLHKSHRQDPQNPYAAYTFTDLNEYLQSHDGKPGKTVGNISYSNLAVGILGNILGQSR
ncbi:MAG: serine hydrolase domain-containing protein [Cyanobacteria bacterium J06659_2]